MLYKKTYPTQRGDAGIGKEAWGNMEFSFSMSSLRSPRLCGEIFCSVS